MAILLRELVYHNYVDHFEERIVQYGLLERYRLQSRIFISRLILRSF